MIRKALLVFAAVAAGATAAAPIAEAAPRKLPFQFRGTVLADATSDSVTVDVNGGNRRALRALLGVDSAVKFTLDGKTKFTIWNGTTPVRGSVADIDAGDAVRLVIWAPRRSSIATLAATPAHRVNDVTAISRPAGRHFSFVGVLNGIDTSAQTIDATVDAGNWQALWLLLGQPTRQTFHYDTTTSFIDWTGGDPAAISPGSLTPGARIRIRIFGKPSELTLGAVLGIPATIVATPAPAPGPGIS